MKFDDFYKFIEQLHGLENIAFHLTYLDKDGELLSINNDTIIEHILRVFTGLLRIFVQRKGRSCPRREEMIGHERSLVVRV